MSVDRPELFRIEAPKVVNYLGGVSGTPIRSETGVRFSRDPRWPNRRLANGKLHEDPVALIRGRMWPQHRGVYLFWNQRER
jgi:hypothetical protein